MTSDNVEHGLVSRRMYQHQHQYKVRAITKYEEMRKSSVGLIQQENLEVEVDGLNQFLG